MHGVPFRGRTRGGESERGRKGARSEEGPLPFWHNFDDFLMSKVSLEKHTQESTSNVSRCSFVDPKVPTSGEF